MRKSWKRLVLSSLVVMGIVTMAGCKKEVDPMVAEIDSGDDAEILVNNPTTYTPVLISGPSIQVDWHELDQLKTYNMGFRQGFDEIFNITTITDGENKGKNGCMYVKKVDGVEVRNGNSTLADSFRNKVFVTKYWDNKETQTELISICGGAYTDVDENSPYGIQASLNAYFNIFGNIDDSGAFYPNALLTREEFYASLYRALNPVEEAMKTEKETNLIPDNVFAGKMLGNGWLSKEDGSLNDQLLKEHISRAEAIYTLVTLGFPEVYEATSGTEQAYNDIKNGGDLALKVGFKTKTEEGSIVEKSKWKQYILAYMIKNKDKMEVQEEIYRAFVAAKRLGILNNSTCRWDEALSRSEAIVLYVNTELAKNKHYGYLTEAEFGELQSASGNIYQEKVDERAQKFLDEIDNAIKNTNKIRDILKGYEPKEEKEEKDKQNE